VRIKPRREARVKIVHVAGARPNFMRTAPTMAALADRTAAEQRLWDAFSSAVTVDERE